MDKGQYYVTVCASGGGGNFEEIIKSQKEVGYKVNLLIVDRECGAIDKAKKYNIPYAFLDKKGLGEDFFSMMDRTIPVNTDLIVLAGFLTIINSDFCQKWQGRIINTHPSLLPKYGGKGMYGVKVQEAVLKNKDELAGCTVHYVSEKIDEGEIILQRTVKVKEGESAWELGGRVFLEENKLLVEAIAVIMSRQADQNI